MKNILIACLLLVSAFAFCDDDTQKKSKGAVYNNHGLNKDVEAFKTKDSTYKCINVKENGVAIFLVLDNKIDFAIQNVTLTSLSNNEIKDTIETLKTIVVGKVITSHTEKGNFKDKSPNYWRQVVILNDEDIAINLLKNGRVKTCKQIPYLPIPEEYLKAEASAKQQKIGIWAPKKKDAQTIATSQNATSP